MYCLSNNQLHPPSRASLSFFLSFSFLISREFPGKYVNVHVIWVSGCLLFIRTLGYLSGCLGVYVSLTDLFRGDRSASPSLSLVSASECLTLVPVFLFVVAYKAFVAPFFTFSLCFCHLTWKKKGGMGWIL